MDRCPRCGALLFDEANDDDLSDSDFVCLSGHRFDAGRRVRDRSPGPVRVARVLGSASAHRQRGG